MLSNLLGFYCIYGTFVGKCVSLCLLVLQVHVKRLSAQTTSSDIWLNKLRLFRIWTPGITAFMWLAACTPCTALTSQEQQRRFSPCCLLSPPPPPLFPPPPSLWRRHTHVSPSHVTFYCGISVDVSLGDIQIAPCLLSFDRWMTPLKPSRRSSLRGSC